VWLEPRLADLPAKDGQLVPEHEDLKLLRWLTSAEKHDQLEQAAENEVDDRHKQKRPPRDGTADASDASAGRAPRPIEYLHPTRGGDVADPMIARRTITAVDARHEGVSLRVMGEPQLST